MIISKLHIEYAHTCGIGCFLRVMGFSRAIAVKQAETNTGGMFKNLQVLCSEMMRNWRDKVIVTQSAN